MSAVPPKISGAQFRQLRKQLGWTQAEAQAFLRLGSVSTIAGWESGPGKRGVPYSAYALLEAEVRRKQSTIPLLGAPIPAGPRDDIEAEAVGVFHWPRPNLNDTFWAATASGVSMTSHGINDGDFLIVRAQETADPGSIVVASVGGEVTVKRLERLNGDLWLSGDTDQVRPSPGELVVHGVVVDVRRSPQVTTAYPREGGR